MSKIRQKLESTIQTCQEALTELDRIEQAFFGTVESVPAQPKPVEAPVKPEVPDLDYESDYVTTGVYASVWGNREDEEAGYWEQLYYPQFKPVPNGGISAPWVSLPAVVPKGTEVYLQHCKQDGTALGKWVGPFHVADLGPWWDGTNGKSRRPEWFDPYWDTHTRPKVELYEKDPRGRKDNGAGIDLTPYVMAMVKGTDPQAMWERPTTCYVNVKVIQPLEKPKSGLISPHFSWEEFSYSDLANKLGINNTIPESVKPNIEALVINLLEPLRTWVGGPVALSSGYRSELLDNSVHASNNTIPSKDQDHVKGFACDIVYCAYYWIITTTKDTSST
jgi:hypothetical protein